MALTSKILPNLDEDDRLTRMLSELDKRYTGADYTEDKNRHVHMFRPCMKKVHVIYLLYLFFKRAKCLIGIFQKFLIDTIRVVEVLINPHSA